MNNLVPPWNDDWSDGCSVPPWLRKLIKVETPACKECCQRHDKLYYYGGTREERLSADLAFRECLIRAGMPWPMANLYFAFVRMGGVPWSRIPGVSWGFGGERFCYDEPMRLDR